MSEHRSCACLNKVKKPYIIDKVLFFLCADCRELQQFFKRISHKKKEVKK